jgi:hypothetical protein
VKNVNDHLHVIEHDPLAGGEAIHGNGAHAVVVLKAALDFARNRLQVGLGSSRADDEKVGEGRDALEIEDDNVLRLFVRREVGAGLG